MGPMSSDHDVPGPPPVVPDPLVDPAPARRLCPAEAARTVVAEATTGALAMRVDDGHPWAALVRYGLLDDGRPVLCVSSLSAHGSALADDPRCSLLAWAETGGDPLAAGRVTLAGQAIAAAGDAGARAAHLAAAPEAAAYIDFGDFDLWVLAVERIRWVGGYGRMAWVEPGAYAAAEPDPTAPAARGAVAHLNADHADALLEVARALCGHPDATAAQCLSIDRYGLDLRIDTPRGIAAGRASFAQPVTAPDGLRAATVALVRAARAVG